MDRTAHRFKIYSDFMKSLGIVQKNSGGYNNWQYEYKPGDSFWIADLQNAEHRFKARVYDFYWKFDGELTAENLYDEEGESLVEYDTKNFREFEKLIKEKLAELNQYDYIRKQHIEKDRLNKLSKDF